jgi:hypothetical protein
VSATTREIPKVIPLDHRNYGVYLMDGISEADDIADFDADDAEEGLLTRMSLRTGDSLHWNCKPSVFSSCLAHAQRPNIHLDDCYQSPLSGGTSGRRVPPFFGNRGC